MIFTSVTENAFALVTIKKTFFNQNFLENILKYVSCTLYVTFFGIEVIHLTAQ